MLQFVTFWKFLSLTENTGEHRSKDIDHIYGVQIWWSEWSQITIFHSWTFSHFQRGIGPYTWLACKTDISEEVRNHRSDVISWLFVVPRLHTHSFSTTHFIVLMLRAIIKTVTNRAALNWFRAPKRFNLWLSENFCLSQRIQESIDPKTYITYMGSKFDGPSGPRSRFFIVIFSVVLALIHG